MADVTLETLAQELAELRARVAGLEAQLQPGARPLVVAPQQLPTQDPLEAAKAAVTALFAAALNAPSLPDEDAFLAFRDLVHADRRGTPLLDEELRAYKWRPLLQRCQQYLARPADPSSFAVERAQPAVLTPQTEIVKLFLRADKRMPPPITLRRDASAGGAWRLEASSL